jgi:hypothetical protein
MVDEPAAAGQVLIMSLVNHCGRCGYLKEFHDLARRCPGMKTGTWKLRDPIDGALWPEILARDIARQMRMVEEVARADVEVITKPPMVVARPPLQPSEFAGYQGRQAVGIGRLAIAKGMDIAPYYWCSGVGVHGCAVKGYRPGLAFVATWKRKPKVKGWSFDIAYAWNPSDRRTGPTRLPGISALEQLLRGQ